MNHTLNNLTFAESLKKFKFRDNNLAIFGGFRLLTSALVMGRIVEKDTSAKAAPKAMRVFLNDAVVEDTQGVNQIVMDAQTYLR